MLVLDMILFELNCQKEQNLQVLLRCLSHALDPFGFGAWQIWPKITRKCQMQFQKPQIFLWKVQFCVYMLDHTYVELVERKR